MGSAALGTATSGATRTVIATVVAAVVAAGCATTPPLDGDLDIRMVTPETCEWAELNVDSPEARSVQSARQAFGNVPGIEDLIRMVASTIRDHCRSGGGGADVLPREGVLDDGPGPESAPTTTLPRAIAPSNPTPPPTAPAPTTTAPTTTVAPRPAQPDRPGAFPGDVAPGHLRFGAAIGANGDPVGRHEASAGSTMGLRRVFFSWSHVSSGYMLRTVREDVVAGRVPWVSVKTPAGWADMASGRRDGEIDAMLRSLDALGGPVWLTIHHEPENDTTPRGGSAASGTAAEWRAMQSKVRQRIDATGVRNLAFAPILMTWTFDPLSGRNPADWWVDGIWDFVGLDHYSERETDPSVAGLRMWQNAWDFVTARGMKVAVGEWGVRGTDLAAAARLQDFHDLALASGGSGRAQIIGMSYFDSNLNSPTGGWELFGEPLGRFRELVAAPTSLLSSDTGF